MPTLTIKRNDELLSIMVDPEDADLLSLRWRMSGGTGSKGRYAARQGHDGRIAYMHRIIAHRMDLVAEVNQGVGGRWRQSIDHANGDKLDNRRANLRLRSRSQQERNPNDRVRTTNTSGFRGVTFTRQKGYEHRPWRAQVSVDRRNIFLGHFATPEEAGAARRAWDVANGHE